MPVTLLPIGKAAEALGVTIQTLRNWDDEGRLLPDLVSEGAHRYYLQSSIDTFLLDQKKIATDWVMAATSYEPPHPFYCQNSAVFQARLQKFETSLRGMPKFSKVYSLVVAIAGEIGNNSFDHNVGNWPDVLGIFFGHHLVKERVVLADRGRGILQTLRSVRPGLADDREALRVAFTEFLTGRAPERRGNGLKYVRKLVVENGMELFFQSGDAELSIRKNDDNLHIKKAATPIRGCLAILDF